jgi:hypothetical protein
MKSFRASSDLGPGWRVVAVWLGAGTIAAVLVSLACGCSVVDASASLSASEARDEYFAEIQSLEDQGFLLSPGAEWPQDPPFTEIAEDGRAQFYGKGSGASWAGSVWFYSWAKLAVSTDDETIRENAIHTLMRVRETAYYDAWAPEDRPKFDQELDEAAQGDLTRLRQDVAVNAPE